MIRIVKTVVLLLLLAVIAIPAWLLVALPKAAPPAEVDIDLADPALLARGTYLVENILLCTSCHSERDWSVYGAPPLAPIGGGRACLDENKAVPGLNDSGTFPGVLCFRNISSHKTDGIGAWSNGEIIRAIREGVGRKGQALFPIMPYFIYRNLADDDVLAVVAYLRSIEPVSDKKPDTRIDFPVNLFIRLAPQPVAGPVDRPKPGNTTEYGAYLATIGRCQFCHTVKTGQAGTLDSNRLFAGGETFMVGEREIKSTNLTPHPDGLGNMSRQEFIDLFKQHETPKPTSVDQNTIMSWVSFSGMSESDLGAIYDFLVTVAPRASTD